MLLTDIILRANDEVSRAHKMRRYHMSQRYEIQQLSNDIIRADIALRYVRAQREAIQKGSKAEQNSFATKAELVMMLDDPGSELRCGEYDDFDAAARLLDAYRNGRLNDVRRVY